MKKKTKETVDPDFIKKAARLLKGEKLNDNELEVYKLHGHVVKNYRRLKINVNKKINNGVWTWVK